jgi:capsular polysaccharide biosynthesis protein
MTEPKSNQASIGFREVTRRWPLIIVVMLIALGATFWSNSRQVPTYTATTRLIVVPLAQWDETFLGTSLARDSGDASRTAATVAAELNSIRSATVVADYLRGGWTPDSVAAAVKVSVFEETNVIQIVARSEDAATAAKLAEGFANAVQADRWRTISAELDARIATVSKDVAASAGTGDDTTAANPTADEAATRLQTLNMIRASGSDPTIKIDSMSLAVQSKRQPVWVILGLAAVGGLFVGILAAVGVAIMHRPVNQPSEVSPLPEAIPAYSPNGGSRTDAEDLRNAGDALMRAKRPEDRPLPSQYGGLPT